MKITQTIAYIAGVALLLVACSDVKDSDLYLYNLGDFVEAAGTWNTDKQTLKLTTSGRYTFYTDNGSKVFAEGDYTIAGSTYTFKSLGPYGDVDVTVETSGTEKSLTFANLEIKGVNEAFLIVNGVPVVTDPFKLNE